MSTLKLPFLLERPSESTPATTATDVDISPITGLTAKTVQTALELLHSSLGGGTMNQYTEELYEELINSGSIVNTFYSVYKDGELYRLYLGETLIMKKAEDDEEVSIGSAFPLVFPIIFA